MWQLNERQQTVQKFQREFFLVMMTPAICAAIVALVPIIMYKP